MKRTFSEYYAEKAGLNINVTPHMFRKTFGIMLAEETGDIYLTANALHHKSIEITHNHFDRQKRNITRDTVTKLDIFNKR